MADKEYVTVVGFVQFEPREREANNQTVRDIAVKPQGDPNKIIRVTLWPEWEGAEVNEGDFVAADGLFTRSTYTANDGTKKESLQISPNKLFVNGKLIQPKGREASGGGSEDLF